MHLKILFRKGIQRPYQTVTLTVQKGEKKIKKVKDW